MQEEEKHTAGTAPFDYMEALSKAYGEAFSKRLRKTDADLSEEKRAALVKMQLDLSRSGGRLAVIFAQEEKKELSRMIKESAEESLRYLRYDEEEVFETDPFASLPPAAILSHAVLLANRSLNLLIRHTLSDEKPVRLVLSELSAIYALAALN